MKDTLPKQSNNIIYENFLSYDTIKLKLYIEIAKTGNIKLLSLVPNPDSKDCAKIWEAIIKKSSQATKSYGFDNYLNSISSLGLVRNEWHMVRLYLIKLYFIVDKEAIEFLDSVGISINTSGAHAYSLSLENAMKNSTNYITRISMLDKEIKKLEEGKEDNYGFEEIIANTSYNIGFALDKDITLAEYNEYQRIISKKHERSKKGTDNNR